MQRETVALIVVSVRWVPLLARHGLRLVAAGDEGREPVDVGSGFALLCGLLRTRRIGGLLARRIGLRVTGQERLRLTGAEGRLSASRIGLLAAHILGVVALIVAHLG